MRPALYNILVCPDCRGTLGLEISEQVYDRVLTGALLCQPCDKHYPIRKGIPRFIDTESYVENFGWQWKRFSRTQIDAFNGTRESEGRFRAETGWRPEEIRGELILDAGCGAGRFSAVAGQWGARVVAVDLNNAVESCRDNMEELGHDVEVVQASLYALPFRPATFDRIFSLGVIQHTPDPRSAMIRLPEFLKAGGHLAFWLYEKRWTRFIMLRSYLRLLTRRLSPRANYALSAALVSTFFPVTLALSRIPGLRRALPLMPISSRHFWGRLSIRQQWEWTMLDTFDSYSPVYELNQTEKDVVHLLTSSGMEEVHRTAASGMAIVGRKAAAVNS
ncbi:MAG TPA: methyltransferase domain-containing protein [Pyrinomonadaceae bacterium]|jgi:2-polyprenyl-3-methyl-5-hydroxy-6-metoxy-1,4-benzoquinol methylase|nr:methyltransferase domain-containing protein [Pyrinomonadaceae bacterium]